MTKKPTIPAPIFGADALLDRLRPAVATGKIKPEFWYVGKKGGLRTGTSLSDCFSAPAKRKHLLTST